MRGIAFIFVFMFSFVLNAQHDHAAMSAPHAPYTIIIFMAVDCPITQKYMGTIKDLAQRYQSKHISVIGYFPAGLSKKEAKQFRAEYQVPDIIQFTDDKKHVITNKYGATITPEVVFIDKNQQVIYQGAIDNWFFELGRYRAEITEHYLIDAIEASLKGNAPAIKKKEAIGCFIQGIAVNKAGHHQH